MTARRLHNFIPALFALFLSLLSPAAARAQADSQRTASAQALYAEALSELDAKQYTSACRKLEEVTKLAPEGLGAKLTLAGCYEALGKLATAWLQYALVEKTASQMGQPERAQKAAQKLAELTPRLAMLTVQVPKEAASTTGLSIALDGKPVGEAQWGMALPVDVGAHEIVATAPGRPAWTKQVEVKADGEQVIVTVDLLEPIREPAAVQAPGKPEPESSAASERPWQRPLGITATVAGGVGIGVGAVLGGMAISENNKANDGNCNPQDQCNKTGYDLRKKAVALGNASTGAIIAGGIVLAGGIAVWATAPSAVSRKERAGQEGGVSARIEVLPGGVQVKGAW